jgi:hypothetical protein
MRPLRFGDGGASKPGARATSPPVIAVPQGELSFLLRITIAIEPEIPSPQERVDAELLRMQMEEVGDDPIGS